MICNAQSYACGNRVHGGLCDSDFIVSRAILEPGPLAGIMREYLTPEVEAEVIRRARTRDTAKKPPEDRSKANATLRAEVGNPADAIAKGALCSSPALADRLQSAERDLTRLEAEVPRPASGSVTRMIPRMADGLRAMLTELPAALPKSAFRAREPSYER